MTLYSRGGSAKGRAPIVEYRVPKWLHGHQAYLSSAGLGLKAQLYRALREPRDQLSRASGTPIVSPRGIQSLVPSSVTV